MLLRELTKTTKTVPSQQVFPRKDCEQESLEQKPYNHLKQTAI
jgi:hypothetical protein